VEWKTFDIRTKWVLLLRDLYCWTKLR
jgi:hypothetical protein